MLPARLESNPDAFGPKYESLGDALKSFNHKVALGEEEIPGLGKGDFFIRCLISACEGTFHSPPTPCSLDSTFPMQLGAKRKRNLDVNPEVHEENTSELEIRLDCTKRNTCCSSKLLSLGRNLEIGTYFIKSYIQSPPRG